VKVLFLDNFDSFSYNLVDELEKRSARVLVFRNDITLQRLEAVVDAEAPALLVISPGPATPARAGVCIEAVQALAGRLPILGVCLGHQVIVEAFGGSVDRAPVPVHGKSSPIAHDGKGLFEDLPSPMTVGRYHSLVSVELPEVLQASARVGDIVMAVRHRDLPVEGLQFHPESILTPDGGRLIETAMAWAGRYR